MLRPVIFPNVIGSSVDTAFAEALSVEASSVEASSVEAFSAVLQVLKHDWSHKRPKMCLRQGPSSGVKHENAFW